MSPFALGALALLGIGLWFSTRTALMTILGRRHDRGVLAAFMERPRPVSTDEFESCILELHTNIYVYRLLNAARRNRDLVDDDSIGLVQRLIASTQDSFKDRSKSTVRLGERAGLATIDEATLDEAVTLFDERRRVDASSAKADALRVPD
jgi:hypothetical protein